MPKSKKPIIIDGDLYRWRRGKLVKVPDEFANKKLVRRYLGYEKNEDGRFAAVYGAEELHVGGGHTHSQTIRKRPSKQIGKNKKRQKFGQGYGPREKFPSPGERVFPDDD